MDIRLIPGALIISGLIAVAVPSNLSLAQSNDVGLSTPKDMMANASLHKHRYWRHRGGKHPADSYVARRDSASNADRDRALTSAVLALRSKKGGSCSDWNDRRSTGNSLPPISESEASGLTTCASFEEAIRATATPRALWFVVPADNKWFTGLIVAAARMST